MRVLASGLAVDVTSGYKQVRQPTTLMCAVGATTSCMMGTLLWVCLTAALFLCGGLETANSKLSESTNEDENSDDMNNGSINSDDVSSGNSNSDLPNIVFIMADDLGYGDVGYYGGPAHTPHLDAMASSSNSVRLDRFYSGAPVCSPTRGTVLTGRNHNRYCIWSANTAGKNCKIRDDFNCPTKHPLPHSEISVAEILKQRGYRTAAFGKWHLGDLKDLHLPNSHPVWPSSHPGHHGFDVWKVTERAVPTVNPNCACFNTTSPLCLMGRYKKKATPPCTTYHSGSESALNELITHNEPIIGDDSNFIAEEFGKFLNDTTVRFKDQPFFAYVALHTVHKRYLATTKYYEEYGMNYTSSDERDYYGAITAMDEAIGKMKSLLSHHNLHENTMIWFTSDNGPAINAPGQTGGLKGRKEELYEGGIRVPGIIEWPAVIKKNWASSYPVVTSDFLPTMCDIVGVDPPSDRPIDGTSILPLLKKQDPHFNSRWEPIMWLFNKRKDFNKYYDAVITMNSFKVFAHYSRGRVVDSYLYDIASDPAESKDVSRQNQLLHSYLLGELEKWRQSVIVSAEEEVGCMRS